MLTNVHGPYDQRIFFKEARSLTSAGYEVTVIAPASPGVPDVRDGVRIRTIPAPAGMLGRCTNVLRLLVVGWRQGAELYHLHDPELLPLGLLLRLLGKKVIYDVHEHFPQVALVRSWIPNALRRTVSQVVDLSERTFACYLSAVVGVVDEQRQRFGRCPFAAVKNFPRLECFPVARTERETERPSATPKTPLLVHIGSLSAERGGLFLLDVMNRLSASHPQARLLCVGTFHTEDVKDRFARRLREYGLVDRVTVQTARVDYERLADAMSGCHVGLIPGQVSAQNLTPFIPTKLFEYMACGIPVVASALPSIRDFYRSGDWGELVPPDDARAHAAAIANLLDRPGLARAKGERGRQLVEQQYNWDREAEKLLIMYGAIVGGASSEAEVARSSPPSTLGSATPRELAPHGVATARRMST